MMKSGKADQASQTDEHLLDEWFKQKEDEKPKDEEEYHGRSHSKNNQRVTTGLLKYQ